MEEPAAAAAAAGAAAATRSAVACARVRAGGAAPFDVAAAGAAGPTSSTLPSSSLMSATVCTSGPGLRRAVGFGPLAEAAASLSTRARLVALATGAEGRPSFLRAAAEGDTSSGSYCDSSSEFVRLRLERLLPEAAGECPPASSSSSIAWTPPSASSKLCAKAASAFSCSRRAITAAASAGGKRPGEARLPPAGEDTV